MTLPSKTAFQTVIEDGVPDIDDHRQVVSSAATIRMNCTGGRPSDAARAAVREYRSHGVDWLRAANAKDRQIGHVPAWYER